MAGAAGRRARRRRSSGRHHRPAPAPISGLRRAGWPVHSYEMPFSDLEARLGYLPEADHALLRRAFEVAERAHSGQFRLTGEPYVEHPVAAAVLLSELRLDAETLAAALLHDTVEDTDVTLEEIRERVRRAHRPAGRGGHQARQDPRPHPGAGPGGEHPQDAGGHGRGHPGRADQARRPPPQHAHGGRPRRGAPPAHQPRDPGHLRAARPPAGHLAVQGGAGGPRLRPARPRQLPRRRGQAAQRAASSARSSSAMSARSSSASWRRSASAPS